MALGRSVLSFGFVELQLHRVTGQVLTAIFVQLSSIIDWASLLKGNYGHIIQRNWLSDVHLFGLLGHEWKI